MKIIPSNRKDKKWRAFFDMGDKKEKVVHFGAKGMRDYTLVSDPKSKFYLKDKEAREKVKAAYIKRHSKEDYSRPDTAGSLSRYILWSVPNIPGAIRNFRKRYSV